MILIGSNALKIRAPFLLKRDPIDVDFICTIDEYNDYLKNYKNKINKIYDINKNKLIKIIEGDPICEFEIIENGKSSALFKELVDADPDTIITDEGYKVPSLDLLFTLKSSHKFLRNSPHFWKTMMDYKLMQAFGAKIKEEYKDFYKIREKETYYYKHPSLNQSKDAFFSDDGIKYVYDHDSIHESVKTYSKPAYTYYLKDNSEVQCDKNKFFSCSKEIQMAGVTEEAKVLAIERSLVPHFGVKTPKQAFVFALSKVCSSITSGYFRDFAYENAFDILKNYKDGYWEKFQDDVANGKVKAYK
jgi:hypothetical protein